jgi:hypothetical protein
MTKKYDVYYDFIFGFLEMGIQTPTTIFKNKRISVAGRSYSLGQQGRGLRGGKYFIKGTLCPMLRKQQIFYSLGKIRVYTI